MKRKNKAKDFTLSLSETQFETSLNQSERSWKPDWLQTQPLGLVRQSKDRNYSTEDDDVRADSTEVKRQNSGIFPIILWELRISSCQSRGGLWEDKPGQFW